MKRYEVEIVEKITYKVSLDAASSEDAENAARRLYDLGALENGELESVTFDEKRRRASNMKKQKVFVLVQHGNDNQDYSSVDVVGVFHTKTAAKERMQEKKDEILGFYKEEYPDNYEVTEDEEEASWCCSCKDSPMFDELVLTEKEVE